jgi:hypothetical protein
MNELQASVENYLFLPLDEARSPVAPGAYMHYVNGWWVVHPEHGLAFWNPVMKRTGRRRNEGLGAPLCNKSESIQRHMAQAIAEGGGWDADVRCLMSAWVPVKIAGYL